MFALRAAQDQTSSQYDPSGSVPSTDPTTVGAGFLQQTLLGTRHVDNFDDRVTYEASIYSDVPQAVSIGLGNNLSADGQQIAYAHTELAVPFMQSPNPTHFANTPPRTDVDAFEQNIGNGGSFSEEQWRPYAGLPLSGTSDEQWAATTGDQMGSSVPAPTPFLMEPGVRHVMERSLEIPDRESRHPSLVQAWRPWDTLMGSWPFTGEKSAQRSPIASQPFNDGDAIANALPSPTGAGGWVGMTNELEVKPLTFRTAPSPWDTENNGSYVDSGV